MKKFLYTLLIVMILVPLSSFAAEENKAKENAVQENAILKSEPAAVNDPFVKWYKPDTQLIVLPKSFDESAREFVSVLRKQFGEQISALPDTEWDANKKIAGHKTAEQVEDTLRSLLTPVNSSNNIVDIPNMEKSAPDFDYGADATAYNLSTCAWHYYFLSLQAKDNNERAYTEASTKVLIAASTAISKIAGGYEAEDKKFDPERNDKAIWQGMLDAENLVYKIADATQAKAEEDSKKLQEIFNRGTKKCQDEGAGVAATILLKAYNKI